MVCGTQPWRGRLPTGTSSKRWCMPRRFSTRSSRPARCCGCAMSSSAPGSARACVSGCCTPYITAASSKRSTSNRFRMTAEIRRRKRYRIGYAAQGQNSSFAREVHASLVARRRPRADIELIVVDNRYQPKIALRNADHLVREDVDLVIEFQTDEAIAPAIASRYLEAGIPIIAIDIPHPGATYFGANNYQAGLLAGRYLGRWAKSVARRGGRDPAARAGACRLAAVRARCAASSRASSRRSTGRGRAGRAHRRRRTVQDLARAGAQASPPVEGETHSGRRRQRPERARRRARLPGGQPRRALRDCRAERRTGRARRTSRSADVAGRLGRLLPRALRRRSHPARARHPGAAARSAGRLRSPSGDHAPKTSTRSIRTTRCFGRRRSSPMRESPRKTAKTAKIGQHFFQRPSLRSWRSLRARSWRPCPCPILERRPRQGLVGTSAAARALPSSSISIRSTSPTSVSCRSPGSIRTARRLQSDRRRRCDLCARPEQRARSRSTPPPARKSGSTRASPASTSRGHQLLAERGRQGQAAALRDQQLSPGDRRDAPASRSSTFGTERHRGLARRPGARRRHGPARAVAQSRARSGRTS